MLKAIREQRLSLKARCDELEAETARRIDRFTRIDAELATSADRVAALEAALQDARNTHAALTQERTDLRERLEDEALALTQWRCLVKRLQRSEAQLEGAQRVCVAFLPETTTRGEGRRIGLPSSFPTSASSSLTSTGGTQAEATVEVLDAHTLLMPSTGLCYTVDAVHPSLCGPPLAADGARGSVTRGARDARAGEMHAEGSLDDVLFSVACEAVGGVSSTVAVTGSSSPVTQQSFLFGPQASSVLVRSVASVLALARRESVQYRVRLSLAQLCPPTLCTSPPLDLLAGATLRTFSVASRASDVHTAESFIPLFDIPSFQSDGRPWTSRLPPHHSQCPAPSVLVSAVPITSVDEVEQLVARAWHRRDALLRAQLTLRTASARAEPTGAVPPSYSTPSPACLESLTGGVVAVLTVETVDVRDQFRHAVLRFVLPPGVHTPSRASPTALCERASTDDILVGEWRRWATAGVSALDSSIKQHATRTDHVTDELRSWPSLGPLSEFLDDLLGRRGKGVLLCCCRSTSPPAAEMTVTAAADSPCAPIVHSVAVDTATWLHMAHLFGSTVHHTESAQTPFCVPSALMHAQDT